MYERRRNIVLRADGRRVNVARFRGQLFVCGSGCCCGQTADGFAPVPAERFHQEWERRKLRNVVHLTVGGCLGPCGLANVVMLLFDGKTVWFHSVNSEGLVEAIYDYVENLLATPEFSQPSGRLASHVFTASTWQPRPDGQDVDDFRPRHAFQAADGGEHCERQPALPEPEGRVVQEAVALMDGPAALPRRNGELVFEEPWHGRVFGMAIALHQRGVFEWEEFRRSLIGRIREMERGEKFVYYEAWMAALEDVLAARALVPTDHLNEVTFQYEFGERDDVY